MTETALALGLPAPFEWRGRTLTVSPVTLKIEGLFASGCERRACEGLRRGRAHLGEQAYRDALQLHKDDLAACEYEWTGRVCEKALQSQGGLRELAWLCVTEARDEDGTPLNPDFSRADMDRLFKDTLPQGEGLSSKWGELVGLINDLSTPHPNGPGPSATAGGRPSAPPTSSPPCAASPTA